MDKNDEFRVSVPSSIPSELKADLASITDLIYAVAQRHQGDEIALLTLLRTLEASHREICDGFFQESLPRNRQQLYSFLREVEAEGGWPYIPRIKLRSLLAFLQENLEQPHSGERDESDW